MAEQPKPESQHQAPTAARTTTPVHTRAPSPSPEPKIDPAIMKQSHKVTVGDNVSLNGTLFHVAGDYQWALTKPDGKDGQLMNPTMPSPSFIAEEVGDYIVTLQTDDGEATITVHVAAA